MNIQLNPPTSLYPRSPLNPVGPVPQQDPADTFSPSLGKYASAAGAAVAGALIEGVGLAGVALIHTPAAVKRAYHDLWTSEHGLLFKGGWSAGIPALAALATPLAGVVGVGLGAFGGAVDGYQYGFGQAMTNCIASLKQLDQFVDETITYEPRRPQ